MTFSPVRQIKPRLESIESAVSAFLKSDYKAALSALHGHSSVTASLVRARCFMRLGRPADAVEELESVEIDSLSASHSAELLAHLVLSHVMVGQGSGHEELLTMARVKAFESGQAAIQAEVELAQAFCSMTEGRLEDARSAATRILEIRDVNPGIGERSLTLTLADAYLRAYDFLGNLAGRENDNLDKAQLLRKGLEPIGPAGRDHYPEAAVLTNLASLGAEIDAPGIFEFVSARLKSMRFSEFTKKFEFEIHRAVGIGNAMHGNHLGAMRSFRRAGEAAPNFASQIKALVDRSMLARELGELLSSEEEIEYALRLAKQVNWSSEKGTEIFALLALARCLAERDTTEARRVFDAYKTCKRGVAFINYANKDLGILARELHVEALIARREGNVPRAIQQSVDALSYFKQIGYTWRAAEVATDLFEMTGESAYFAYAAEHAEKIPQSHLARRVRSLAAAPAPASDALAG